MLIKSPTLSTARKLELEQHRAASVSATREALRRTITQRHAVDSERRLAAYQATREAAILSDLAHDRASSTQIACVRKVADCG